MSLSVACPACAARIKAPDQLAGKQVQCPKCGERLLLPSTTGPAAKPPSSSPLPHAIVPPALPAPRPPEARPLPVTDAFQGHPTSAGQVVGRPEEGKACPFCGEPILAVARKCKHCGETLDPARRAVQETTRAAERSQQGDFAFDAREEGRPSSPGVNTTVVVQAPPREFPHLLHLVITLFFCGAWLPIWILHYLLRSRDSHVTAGHAPLRGPSARRVSARPPVALWLLGGAAGFFLLSCGGCLAVGLWNSAATAQALQEADRQYAAGDHAAAIPVYKDKFNSVTDKGTVLKRIVEYEAQQGDAAEMSKWVKKGFDDGVEASYDSPAAQQALSALQKERDDRAAKEQAEREAQAKALKEREAKAPGDSAGQAKKRWALRVKTGKEVPVAVSKEALDRLTQLAAANDDVGIRRLGLSGLIFAVPNGTEVVVIESGFLSSEVRIQQGPHAGEAVWAASDFLTKE